MKIVILKPPGVLWVCNSAAGARFSFDWLDKKKKIINYVLEDDYRISSKTFQKNMFVSMQMRCGCDISFRWLEK